jgi:hypothetical protein
MRVKFKWKILLKNFLIKNIIFDGKNEMRIK